MEHNLGFRFSEDQHKSQIRADLSLLLFAVPFKGREKCEQPWSQSCDTTALNLEPTVTIKSSPTALNLEPRVTIQSSPTALDLEPRVTIQSSPTALNLEPRVTIQPSLTSSIQRMEKYNLEPTLFTNVCKTLGIRDFRMYKYESTLRLLRISCFLFSRIILQPREMI
jgi:hypothetical protein